MLALKNGFTLVELLIVIAIIAILSSTALLGLNSMRGKARNSAGKHFESTIDNAIRLNLVGEWKFEDSLADGYTNDSSGYSNAGQVTGSVIQRNGSECIRGSCIELSGGEIDINDADILDIPGDFTISAWVKRTGDGGTILSKGTVFPWNYDLYMRPSDNIVRYFLDRFDHGGVFDSTFTMGANIFYHVAVTRRTVSAGSTPSVGDTYELTFFIDGAKSGRAIQTRIAAETEMNDQPLTIGWDGQYRFTGIVDEVRLYNEALTVAQIKSLYSTELAMR